LLSAGEGVQWNDGVAPAFLVGIGADLGKKTGCVDDVHESGEEPDECRHECEPESELTEFLVQVSCEATSLRDEKDLKNSEQSGERHDHDRAPPADSGRPPSEKYTVVQEPEDPGDRLDERSEHVEPEGNEQGAGGPPVLGAHQILEHPCESDGINVVHLQVEIGFVLDVHEP